MAPARRYLGLDLGTTVGYALAEGDRLIRCGARDFSARAHEHIGHRGIMFYNFLNSLGQVDEIYYEKIQFTGNRPGGGAWSNGEVYKGFLMLMNMYAAGYGVPTIGVWPSTLKKSFTGSGVADKEQMCAQAHALGWRGGCRGTIEGHDEADAIALLVTQLRERYNMTLRL